MIVWSVKWGASQRLVDTWRLRGRVIETLDGPSCRGCFQCQKADPVTSTIKYLEVLIVEPESVPVPPLPGWKRVALKEALWTSAVNFLLPYLVPSLSPWLDSKCLHSWFVCSWHKHKLKSSHQKHFVIHFSVSQQTRNY